MERQARNHHKAWKCSGADTLEHVYKSYSGAKLQAWRYCEAKTRELNGYGLKVITHNCMVFTAGFEYYDEKAQTVKFYYIAPTFDCAIEITAYML